jgi:hypothetical protein
MGSAGESPLRLKNGSEKEKSAGFWYQILFLEYQVLTDAKRLGSGKVLLEKSDLRLSLHLWTQRAARKMEF